MAKKPCNKRNSVVFSLALNGYGREYEDCLESQRIYAQRIGSDLIQCRSNIVCSAGFCAWLKLPMAIQLFEAGYTEVLYIDADCTIRENAPNFTEAMAFGSSIFMALGWSGRLNSGVIMVRPTAGSRRCLEGIINDCCNPVPESHRAQYENGHMIHWLTDKPELKVLDKKWNSIQCHEEEDFVWHFTGPNARAGSGSVSRTPPAMKVFRLATRWMSRLRLNSNELSPSALRSVAGYLMKKTKVISG